jgi:hypothetical protein
MRDPTGYEANCFTDSSGNFGCTGVGVGFGNGSGGNGSGNGCLINCSGGTTTPGTGGSAGNLVGLGGSPSLVGLGGSPSSAGGASSNTNSVCGVVNCGTTTMQMGLYSNANGSSYLITSPNNWQQINAFVNSTLDTGADRFRQMMSGEAGVNVACAGCVQIVNSAFGYLFN